jgi:hypothetical protein
MIGSFPILTFLTVKVCQANMPICQPYLFSFLFFQSLPLSLSLFILSLSLSLSLFPIPKTNPSQLDTSQWREYIIAIVTHSIADAEAVDDRNIIKPTKAKPSSRDETSHLSHSDDGHFIKLSPRRGQTGIVREISSVRIGWKITV